MIGEIPRLEALLNRSPEDWSARIRLIEEYVRWDDMDGARRLVRESPDDSPLPYELQHRLHALMTQGKAALVFFEGSDTAPLPDEPAPGDREKSVKAEEGKASASPAEPNAPETESSPEKPEPKTASGEPLTESKKPKGPIGITRVDLKKLREKRAQEQAEADSDLFLAEGEVPRPQSRQSAAPQKISALTMALLFHVCSFFLLGFIVIAIPRPNPPKLIATVVQETQIDMVPTRITRLTDPKPAAASTAPANVIASLANSSVRIPEFEKSQSVDVTAMVTGIQPTGIGVSFMGDAREMSDVNFFGISAGGKRIVFIIDATKFMLLDEKGGMFAYDKVKAEIGAMLAGLNRGTHFNILLYEGSRVVAFEETPVPGLPSNIRRAIDWLDPLNRTYEELGLVAQGGPAVQIADEIEPIQRIDLAHYVKPIQKALEWEAESIFCIGSGYYRVNQSPSVEMLEKYREELAKNPGEPGTPGEFPPGAREKWNEAIEKTREWLQKENAARAEKELPPKVVINFNQLVREITGETPPRRSGGTPGNPGARYPNQPPHTPEDIELQVKNGVSKYYREDRREPPSLHMVVFIGEDEEVDDQTKDHFKNLTRKNNGKLKILRGLAMLEDVTSKK
jgi:hypothetical protein